MTKADRESLQKVCRLRAKVAKADVVALAAQRKAAFEKEMATIYSFDDDSVWKQAMLAATAAVEEAKQVIHRRCKELGIPSDREKAAPAPKRRGIAGATPELNPMGSMNWFL
jgi:hypothetical protein